MEKRGRELAIGDELLGIGKIEDFRPQSHLAERPTIVDGDREAARQRSLDQSKYLMTVAVKIGGEWRPLRADGAFEIKPPAKKKKKAADA